MRRQLVIAPDAGIELSRRFYGELVRPWLAASFPNLRHAAALIGYGSELLGFDDAMSQDHNWGPRVLVFVSEADFAERAPTLVSAFAGVAPAAFLGAPTGGFTRPHASPDRAGALGDDRHGLEVWTIAGVLDCWLGLKTEMPQDSIAWLSLAEQRLLSITAGAVFRDDDGRLTALRQRLAWFPRDIWLYKLACQWRRIAEAQAFVGRAGLGGDEIGSRVIAASLARDTMRMAYLIERRYAPYAKWLGKGFAQLPCAPSLMPILGQVLSAPDWKTRETSLAEGYLKLARLHRDYGLPGSFQPVVGPYFGRPFMVINAEAIAEAVRAQITDPAARALPLIGSLDQVTDSAPVLESPDRARRAMYSLLDVDEGQ